MKKMIYLNLHKKYFRIKKDFNNFIKLKIRTKIKYFDNLVMKSKLKKIKISF